MPGEVSETAKMTTQGNTDGAGAGMNDGVPPAADSGQVPDGQPKEYPKGEHADVEGEKQSE